jgi:hypothetical protein
MVALSGTGPVDFDRRGRERPLQRNRLLLAAGEAETGEAEAEKGEAGGFR